MKKILFLLLFTAISFGQTKTINRTGAVTTITKSAIGLGNVDNTSDTSKPVSNATQIALDSKQATLVSGANIKTIEGQALLGSGNIDLSKSDIGLSNVDNTSDTNKPVSTATQTAINTASTSDRNRANHTGTQEAETVITSITFDGGITNPPRDIITTVRDLYQDTTTKLATKASLASPTFTGTVSGITKSMVGLGNVDNTSDANKPISTATQSSLNTKEPTISAGTTTQYWRGDKSWQTLDKTVVGLGSVDNTSDANKPVSNATQTALNLKANLASPTFTGTVSGVTKAMVGLGSVDNTSDASKPISTATQNALNGKENNISSGTTSQYYRGDKSWQDLNAAIAAYCQPLLISLGNVTGATSQTIPALDSKYNFLRVRARFGGFATAWMLIDLRNSNSFYTLECPTSGTIDSATQFRRYNIQVAYNTTTRVLSITKVGMQTITAGSAGTITYTDFINDAGYYLTDFEAIL